MSNSFPARLFSGELPVDRDVIAIHASIPGFGLAAQHHDVPDPTFPQALAAEQADFDLGLIEPASMPGRAMHRESFPEPSARFFAKSVYQRFTGEGTQVVQHQMDGIGGGVMLGNLQQEIGELGRRARGRHLGEMNPRLGLNAAEDVGCSAAQVLIIPPCNSSLLQGSRRPRMLMQHHWFLINANYWFTLCQRLFVDLEHVLHTGDVLLIQLRHAPHFSPATASGRGFPATPEWSLGPRAEPAYV